MAQPFCQVNVIEVHFFLTFGQSRMNQAYPGSESGFARMEPFYHPFHETKALGREESEILAVHQY